MIIISELLAEDHYDDEDYVILREQDIVSEVRETAWRHFGREINDEMAAWLEHHRDPDDEHLERYSPSTKSGRCACSKRTTGSGRLRSIATR